MADECEITVMEFYIKRLEEGLSLNEVDSMDIIYFMNLMCYKTKKDEEKVIAEYDNKGL